MEGRLLQRRDKDKEDHQRHRPYRRPAPPAEERAAEGAPRFASLRRVRPPGETARRLLVAGGSRGRRVVLHGLHDLRFPAWPRVSVCFLSYLDKIHCTDQITEERLLHNLLYKVAWQELCEQRTCLAVQRSVRGHQNLPTRALSKGMSNILMNCTKTIFTYV